MSVSVITISNIQLDQTQKRTHIYGQINVPPGGVYPAGGFAFDSVLLAQPGVTTNSGIKFTQIQSETGSGYIYQRIPSTGKMMILQVPLSGSLTTAAPLNEIPSSTSLIGIANDVIAFHATILRNA